jgi:intracellular sulfur oxidation DsrE/DsrF family protein
VVAYGPRIGMLKTDSAAAPQIAAALKNEVKAVACENTMQLNTFACVQTYL